SIRLQRTPRRSLGHRRLYRGASAEPPCLDRRRAAERTRATRGTTMKAKLAVIAVAALVLLAGLAMDPRSTLAAWRVVWVAIGAIPLGVLCLLMTSYLVRRAWTEALHGIMVSATSVLPVLGVLLLPVLIGMEMLY